MDGKGELGIDGTALRPCMKYSGSIASSDDPLRQMNQDRQLRRGGLICKYAYGLKSPLAVRRPGVDV
jgi:hypothetical protein